MSANICYLGDDNLQMAAAYLGGIMLHYGLEFDHVPSNEAPPNDFTSKRYTLYVLSDYRAVMLGNAMAHIVRCVEQGSGLAMFGGWDSYHGRYGEYHESPLADVLPVTMQKSDDRCNSAQPCLLNKTAEHPILEGLPWNEPPGIGGYNAVTAKPGSQTLLTAVRFAVHRLPGMGDSPILADTNIGTVPEFQFVRGEESPILVVGRHGQGRVAALATDVAPHWVGGFVDWGDARISQEIGGGMVEIGNWYARFFRNLLAWTGQF